MRILVQALTKSQEEGATSSDLFGWLCEEEWSLDEEEDHSQLPSFCLFVCYFEEKAQENETIKKQKQYNEKE